MSVTNTLPSANGEAEPRPSSTGIGLANVRNRLVTRYGDGAALTAGRSAGALTSAIVVPRG